MKSIYKAIGVSIISLPLLLGGCSKNTQPIEHFKTESGLVLILKDSAEGGGLTGDYWNEIKLSIETPYGARINCIYNENESEDTELSGLTVSDIKSGEIIFKKTYDYERVDALKPYEDVCDSSLSAYREKFSKK